MDIGKPSEKLRRMLLEQELKLRKKQPEHWAKTEYRKYAKPYTPEELEKLKEMEKQRTAEKKAAKKTTKGKSAKKKRKTK